MGLKGGNRGLDYFRPLKGKNLPEVKTSASDPSTSEASFDPGDIWINKTTKQAFMFISATGGIGTWESVGAGDPQQIESDFISGVLAKVAVGAAVATEGNRYIANATGGGWTANYIYTYQNGAWVEMIPTEGALTYNNDTNAFTYFTGAAWAAMTSGVTTLAGLTDTDITGAASGELLIYDGTNSWDNVAMSGHGTITNLGVLSVTGIATGAILDDGGANDAVLAFTTQTVGAPTLTVPDFASVNDTFAFVTLAQTFANKTIDCASNTVTNVDIEELQAETIPAADGNNVTIVDGLIIAKVSNNATNFNIFSANAPYAFAVIDAWSINLSADGGTWKINNGAAGAGTDITNVVTVAASDKDVDRITTIDDAAFTIAASGSLSLVFDGAGVLDAYIFIKIARLA